MIALDLVAFVLGAALYLAQFGTAFMGSRLLYAAVAARFVCAFWLGRKSRGLAWSRQIFRFCLLECGAIWMVAWALMNLSATAHVGFRLELWLVPVLFDLAGWFSVGRGRHPESRR